MALEKVIKLRRMDLVFTEGKVHQNCHCEYDVVILEDGVEIARTSDRRKVDAAECKSMLSNAEVRPEPKAEEEQPLVDVNVNV